jgi:hypothetical protein
MSRELARKGANTKLIYRFLRLRVFLGKYFRSPKPCVILSKSERRRSEDESKDPYQVSSTMPHQGILSTDLALHAAVS